MTIEDRITELMAHHKESLARMVAESEPDQAAEIIAQFRSQNADMVGVIHVLDTRIVAMGEEIATLQAELAAKEVPPEATAEPAQ